MTNNNFGEITDTGKIIELIACMEVTEEALIKAREFLCVECRDRRCENGNPCRAFEHIAKGFAWEITATRAKLN